MKSTTELTDRDCIHCSTQEEWDGVLKLHNPLNLESNFFTPNNGGVCLILDGRWDDLHYFKSIGFTIIPASDFLPATPAVSVLHQIGDYSLIRNGSELIIIKGSQAMTLTGEVIELIKTI